jgi:hypothetical protein
MKVKKSMQGPLPWISVTAAAILATVYLIGAEARNPHEYPAQGYPAQDAQEEAIRVSDEKLEQFAEARASVQEIQQEYAVKADASDDALAAQSLREEAREKMVEAVHDSGLSVSEYNQIAQRVQIDPDLARRLNALPNDR